MYIFMREKKTCNKMLTFSFVRDLFIADTSAGITSSCVHTNTKHLIRPSHFSFMCESTSVRLIVLVDIYISIHL